jgi:predicted SnoaL-like aldol condensation-catalyzing enzyme
VALEDNKAVVMRIFDETWNQGKLNVLDEVLTPETLFHSPIRPEPMLGAGPLKGIVSFLKSGFPDIQFTVDDIFGAGDLVAVRWTSHQTHTVTYMGVPPTGKKLSYTGNIVFRMVDAKVVEFWEIVNAMGVLSELGLAPPLPT